MELISYQSLRTFDAVGFVTPCEDKGKCPVIETGLRVNRINCGI